MPVVVMICTAISPVAGLGNGAERVGQSRFPAEGVEAGAELSVQAFHLFVAVGGKEVDAPRIEAYGAYTRILQLRNRLHRIHFSNWHPIIKVCSRANSSHQSHNIISCHEK